MKKQIVFTLFLLGMLFGGCQEKSNAEEANNDAAIEQAYQMAKEVGLEDINIRKTSQSNSPIQIQNPEELRKFLQDFKDKTDAIERDIRKSNEENKRRNEALQAALADAATRADTLQVYQAYSDIVK